MRSPSKDYFSYLGVFIAVASGLQIAEWFLPRPFPWLKLGLANLVTLVGIMTMGNMFAVKVALGRVFLSSFLLGTFLSPTFYLSLSGALVSCLVMILFYKPLGKLSPIGVSILGAVSHNLIQVVTAYLILVRHPGIFVFFPFLLIAAVITGAINGYLVLRTVPAVAEYSLKRIYLISESRRRIDIMQKAGLPFISVSPRVEEDRPESGQIAGDFCLQQAEKKLYSVEKNLSPPGCAIASDTVVEIEQEILGKPLDTQQAAHMLRNLSGKIQKVHTAVVVRNLSTGKALKEVETTTLKMKKLTEEEIEELKNRNLDKAGGYAIQGMKDRYIDWIKGSYTNVVGFPVEKAAKLLVKIWK